MFTIFCTSQSCDFDRMLRFAFQTLIFTQFESERVIVIAKNLLSNLTELKRDGDAMLAATTNRFSYSSNPDPTNYQYQNDISISIFKQEAFLKEIIRKCKLGHVEGIIQNLNSLRDTLLSQSSHKGAIVRLGIPLNFSLSPPTYFSSQDLADYAQNIWHNEFSKRVKDPITKRKRQSDDDIPVFPLERTPYSVTQCDKKLGTALMMAIPGLNSSYVSQFIPCDIMGPYPHPDYFAVILLNELLSRTEGPVFTAVRGKGFAYGASFSLFTWHGQLSIEIYRSSEPLQALMAIHDIIKSLSETTQFDIICSDFNIQTAQSSVAYNFVCQGSTPCSVLSTSLRNHLWVTLG